MEKVYNYKSGHLKADIFTQSGSPVLDQSFIQDSSTGSGILWSSQKIDNELSNYSLIGHNHSAEDINSGILNDDRLSSNVPLLDNSQNLFQGNITVAGNLVVQGSGITAISSGNIFIKDPIITLGPTGQPIIDDGKDRGIEFKWYDNQPNTGFFGFNRFTKRFVYIPSGMNFNESFSGEKGVIEADLLGNSDTASKWSNPRTLYLQGDVTGDASFDGSSDIYLNVGISGVEDLIEEDVKNIVGSFIVGGSGIDINYIPNVSLTINHSLLNTSDISSNNSGGSVVQNLSVYFDEHGHVTGSAVDVLDLDTRYYTETEIDTFNFSVSGHEHNASDINSGIFKSGNFEFQGDLYANGHFSAKTKAFVIDHPSKSGKRLRHGAVESPEWGVLIRGKSKNKIIFLPDYWEHLVDKNSVTVSLTPVGKFQKLYVKEQNNKHIKIGGVRSEYNYVIYGERKDVEKMEVEF